MSHKKINGLLLSVILFAGCQKVSLNEERQNTSQKVTALNTKYTNLHSEIKSRSWKQYAAADAVGGLTNAGWGASVAGPWGALCGGIAGGIYASCILDYFSLVVPNTTGPIVENGGPSLPGTGAKYSDPGSLHNAALNDLLLHKSSYTVSEGKFDLQKIQNYCVATTCSQFKFDNLTLQKVMDHKMSIDEISRYSENPASYFETLGKTQFRYICEDFFNKAFSFDDAKALQEYSLAFARIISAATDLSNVEKSEILTYSSIATASLLYHNF